jgi:hypothetical protein
LRCFVRVLVDGCEPSADTRRVPARRPKAPRWESNRSARTPSAGRCCACTHYLVFKEPSPRPASPDHGFPLEIGRFRPRQGNLLRLLPKLAQCQQPTSQQAPRLRWCGMNDSGSGSPRAAPSTSTRPPLPGWRPSGEPVNPTGGRPGCQPPRHELRGASPGSVDPMGRSVHCQPRPPSMRIRKFSFFPLRTTNS